MLKLPEASDRKYEQHKHKEKVPSQQKKKKTRSLSTMTGELKTPISFLLVVKR